MLFRFQFSDDWWILSLSLSLSLYLWTWLKAIDIRHGRKGTDEKGITRSIRTKCSCKPVYFFFSSITGYGLTSTTSVQQHMWWVCGWIRKNIRFFSLFLLLNVTSKKCCTEAFNYNSTVLLCHVMYSRMTLRQMLPSPRPSSWNR